MSMARVWCVLTLLALLRVGALADELLVTSFVSDRVSRFDLSSGAFLGTLELGVGLDGALATRVGPDGLLYVASEGSNTIQRYSLASGAFVDTFVTAGSGGLDGPTGMTWGADGDLYVPSFNTDSVLRYDGASGAYLGVAVAGGFGALDGPDNGTIFGPDGALYVPSFWNNRILRYDLGSGTVSTFVSFLSRPRVLEFSGDRLLVTVEGGDRVKIYDAASGSFVGDLFGAGAGGLDEPIGMVLGASGDVYVSSLTNDNVLRYDATSGAFLSEFLAPGAGGIDGPTFLTIVPEPAGASLLIALTLLAAAPRRSAPR